MSDGKRDIFIRNTFSTVAPYVDPLSAAFSFGLSHVWRRTALTLSGIGRGDRVLDVCTGTGPMAMLLAGKVGPDGYVVGVDFCEDMLRVAKKKTASGFPNISFVLSDAKSLCFSDGMFDAVTVAFGMRNITDTIPALKEINRVLRPGGSFICLELTRPDNPLFLPIYKFYLFRVMPFIGRVVTKSNIPYSYLPRSIESFYRPDEFSGIIGRYGFSDVKICSLNAGVAAIYVSRKS